MMDGAGAAGSTERGWLGFDRWAGVVLAVTALVALVAVLATAGVDRVEPLARLAGVLRGVGSAIVLMVGAAGLARGSPWARPLATALLWLLVTAGAITVVADLGGGKTTFPFAAIGAILVLRTRPKQPGPTPLPRARRLVALGAGAYLVALAFGPAGAYVLGPGNSPLSVAPDALDLRGAIDCTVRSGQPVEARLIATWTWRQHEWLALGEDALALRWRTTDATGQPRSGFYLREAPGTGFIVAGTGPARDTTYPGRDGVSGPFWLGIAGPNSDRLSALDMGSDSPSTGVHVEPVMIELGRQQLRDDSFAVVIAAESAVDASGVARSVLPDHGSLAFDVGYLHLGRWVVWADAQGCSW